MAQIPNEIIVKFDDDLKERVAKWIEDDFIHKDKIKTICENIGKDIQATKKSKDFRMYNNDGIQISKREHLDKLFFIEHILRGLI